MHFGIFLFLELPAYTCHKFTAQIVTIEKVFIDLVHLIGQGLAWSKGITPLNAQKKP